MDTYLYTLAEVRAILKVDKNLPGKLVKKGYLKAMKLGCLKVSKYELERFLKEYAGKNLDDLDNIVDLVEKTN